MDADSIDRIIDAVAKAPKAGDINFEKINKSLLRRDLEWCADWYDSLKSHGPGKPKERIKRLNRIRKSAAQLVCLLRVENREEGLIATEFPMDGMGPLSAVKRVIEITGRELKFRQQTGKMSDPKNLTWLKSSPFNWLVGKRLACLFEKHFGIKAGYTHHDGADDGPFIRFADSALWELKITKRGERYQYASIAKALNNARSNRARRRTKT